MISRLHCHRQLLLNYAGHSIGRRELFEKMEMLDMKSRDINMR